MGPPVYNDSPELNVVCGASSYLELLELIHGQLAPRLYVEVGVRNGRSLILSNCVSIAIDPEPELSRPLPKASSLYRRTSDDFFKFEAEHTIQGKIDFGFIDGMHLFEYSLRDFINIEKYSAVTSLIAVDDIFPNHPVQAKRERESRVWTGDVWKLLTCLQRFRPDLILLPVNTAPTGTLLIAGLDPLNRELVENYEVIMRRFVTESAEMPPADVLGRLSAIEPDDKRITELLCLLRSCRDNFPGQSVIRDRLEALTEGFISSSQERRSRS